MAMNKYICLRKVCVMFMFVAAMFLATACSNNDYLNAIPSTATALMRIDQSKLDGEKAASAFSSILPNVDLANSGIDWKSSAFAFETIDGNFGLCVKVKDQDKLENTFSELAKSGKCGNVRKQGDFAFSDINNSWAVGFSDKAMLILGPVSAASLPDTQQSMAKMLRQDEDASIVVRPMYAKLDSMDGAVSMVAQVQALPEKFVAPFTIGAPKDADASQVLIAADFSKSGSVITMKGETFSFDKSIDAALKTSNGVYRKINGDYLGLTPGNSMLGLFVNVDGKRFLPLLQNNKPMQALLAGMNTAIDFDNIIRSVDGDMELLSSGISAEHLNMTMYAKVPKPTWIADIDYWKQSCPAGSSITGGNGAWIYNSGNGRFAFGMDGNMFYGTTDETLASKDNRQVLPLSSGLTNIVKGSRLVMLLNLKAITSGGNLPQGFGNVINPLLGNVETLVYVMK